MAENATMEPSPPPGTTKRTNRDLTKVFAASALGRATWDGLRYLWDQLFS